jgi:hypothetical protein
VGWSDSAWKDQKVDRRWGVGEQLSKGTHLEGRLLECTGER